MLKCILHTDEAMESFDSHSESNTERAFVLLGWSAALGCAEAQKNLGLLYVDTACVLPTRIRSKSFFFQLQAAGRSGFVVADQVMAAHWCPHIQKNSMLNAVECLLKSRLAVAAFSENNHARVKLAEYVSRPVRNRLSV